MNMQRKKMTMEYFLLCCLIGLMMGVLSGLIGIGGGIVAVPMMIYLLEIDPRVAMGTSLAIIVPVALAGALKRHHQGDVDWTAVIGISVTGIAAGVLGAWLSSLLSSLTLQRVFAVFMIIVGVKMMFPRQRQEPGASAAEPLPQAIPPAEAQGR